MYIHKTTTTKTVYVFIGEHIAMIDFLRCLQSLKLLQTGQYMVISVDDEIYDPSKQSDIIGRGNKKILSLKMHLCTKNIDFFFFDTYEHTDYLDPYINRTALALSSFRAVLKMTMSYPSNPEYE